VGAPERLRVVRLRLVVQAAALDAVRLVLAEPQAAWLLVSIPP
jgi:hypothetical protein